MVDDIIRFVEAPKGTTPIHRREGTGTDEPLAQWSLGAGDRRRLSQLNPSPLGFYSLKF